VTGPMWMATKEELTAERKRYQLARTLESYVRQIMRCMRGVTPNGILVWKLAYTRARCRESQSAASRTSLGTRL